MPDVAIPRRETVAQSTPYCHKMVPRGNDATKYRRKAGKAKMNKDMQSRGAIAHRAIKSVAIGKTYFASTTKTKEIQREFTEKWSK